MLLDAAHDAEAIYLLLDHQNTEPFIDLNNRSKKNTKTGGDIRISPKGVPICSAGLEMKSNGRDDLQNRQKWRCAQSHGIENSCPTPCSKAKYGRTYHTHSKDNDSISGGGGHKCRTGMSPKMRIRDRSDSSTQPSVFGTDKLSKELECGLWTTGQVLHWKVKTDRNRPYATLGIHDPRDKPESPP